MLRSGEGRCQWREQQIPMRRCESTRRQRHSQRVHTQSSLSHPQTKHQLTKPKLALPKCTRSQEIDCDDHDETYRDPGRVLGTRQEEIRGQLPDRSYDTYVDRLIPVCTFVSIKRHSGDRRGEVDLQFMRIAAALSSADGDDIGKLKCQVDNRERGVPGNVTTHEYQ